MELIGRFGGSSGSGIRSAGSCVRCTMGKLVELREGVKNVLRFRAQAGQRRTGHGRHRPWR